jgi:phosphatidylinositol alpha-mannosyltransferase
MLDVKNKLKIGFVFDDSLDKSDGVQQYILALGEWMRAEGHDVHYLVGQTTRTDIQGIHSLSRNLNVIFNGNRLSVPLPTSKTKLKKFINDQNFDVLHVQMPFSPFLAGRLISAADVSKTVIIGTFHILSYGQLVTLSTKLLEIWSRRTLKRFNEIVSVSSVAASFAKQTFRIDSTVLPNVIDYQRFASAAPMHKYDDKLNILFLGRLVHRKGCQVLLEAINLIKDDTTLPEFRVLICGKGPLANKLQRYSISHGLGSIVEFVGYVSEDDKAGYYKSSDIAVFPSRGGESFGIVLLEAMASGSAVMAGDNPGYRSVMEDKPELIFDPNDTHSLAEKLRNYLLDDNLRQQVAWWGQDYSINFDIPKVGWQLLDKYNQALRNRRG